jgi:hypothetical protein
MSKPVRAHDQLNSCLLAAVRCTNLCLASQAVCVVEDVEKLIWEVKATYV